MIFFPPGVPPEKRCFDLFLTGLGLILVLPLILILTLAILLIDGKPAIFTQTRPGYKGNPFRVYKFRTMTGESDSHGNLLPDSDRLTHLGKILRASSLDELPEIINVMRGDMSLVGPRPLLTQYLERYSKEQAHRHDVLPGITGWAQVNGRNAITWEEKFALDIWYVDHWSFWLDIKILLRTALSVIRREGINQPGRATADEFKGNTKIE